MRRFRAALWASAAATLVASVLSGCTAGSAGTAGAATTSAAPVTSASGTPTATAAPTVSLVPTMDWLINSPSGTSIEGFADHASVLPGQSVQLRVSATASSFSVAAFRMGSYGSSPAALAWHGGPFPTVKQPPATVVAATRTVTTSWKPTATVPTAGWPAGAYLLRLEGADHAESYVPLTIRSASTAGRVVLVQAVTTWQAYNDYGGLSLFHGTDKSANSRSYAVSFDRPYAEETGAGNFLDDELPLISFAEGLKIPLAYATDLDLDADPHLLDGARGVVSPGHDEYYSTNMRQALTTARDAGTNVLFLGASAVHQHIRLSPTALGADRLETDYKDPRLDPLRKTNPDETTSLWRSKPVPRPESVLVGGFYQCNPAEAYLVVAPELSWLTDGLGLHPGETLGVLVGPAYDRVDLSVPTPHPIQVIFHSPLRCGASTGTISDASDVTYYTAASGAGVFDAGTSKWECALSDTACNQGWGDQQTFAIVREVTSRLLVAAAAGPMGKAHPAVDTTGGAPGPDDGIAGIAAAH